MPQLEKVDLSYDRINDISSVSHCKKLKRLDIRNNKGIEDLSPLCLCPDLEKLSIWNLPLIKDLTFFEEGGHKAGGSEYQLPTSEFEPSHCESLTRLPNLE